jgi:DNA-binding Lrp family transcriptional regulator
MARAYLKVSVETGREREIRDALRSMSAVKAADLTTGDQDLMVVVEAPNYEALLKIIIEEIRRIKGIETTSTSLVLE